MNPVRHSALDPSCPCPAAGPALARFAETLLLGLAAALVGYAAWARGGTYEPWQAPLPALSSALLAARLAGSALAGGGPWARAVGKDARSLMRDPVFICGLLFLVLLAVQAWNSGRPLVFDPERVAWFYGPPPAPGLPSAFTAREGRQMLVWFFPAWALAVGLRAPWLRPRSVYAFWTALALNAAALALFGSVRLASGSTCLPGGEPAGHERFFASFAYTNHAGSYFVLMFCLCGGLWIRELLIDPSAMRLDGRSAVRLAATLLTLTGAFLSGSRASILLAAGMAAAMAAYLLRSAWSRMRPASRLHLALGLLAAVALACFLIVGIGRSLVADELASLSGDRLDRLLAGNRLALAQAALGVWRESPWFGAGGWGFRYLLAFHMPAELAGQSLHGLANVHNDFLQFLAEFGVVGVGLMMAALMALVRPALQAGVSGRPALEFAAAGAILTAMQSTIDLPFRCPAILCAWVAVVSGISCLAGAGRSRGRSAEGDQRR